jgi:hypothetical protein
VPTQTSKQKSAWDNRFEIPSQSDLIAGLNHQMHFVAEHARHLLVQPGCVKEAVAWQGVWKWTFSYTCTLDQSRPWAYIIPDPSKLRICVPLAENVLTEIPLKKISRFVRDVIVHAAPVGQLRWPMWEVQTKAQAADVLELCTMKLAAMNPKPLGV